MESLVELATGLLVLMILAVPLAFVYRYRAVIKKWITDKESYTVWDKSAATRAERDIIKAQWRLDDAKTYAEWVATKDAQEEADRSNSGD